VFRELTTCGYVYTLRTERRTTGRTWVCRSRTGGKVGEAVVAHAEAVEPVTADALAPYAHASGLVSADNWLDTIEELHGVVPAQGHVYTVTWEGEGNTNTK
jgi:hypothetical protein